jgi:microcystin-dependent protein
MSDPFLGEIRMVGFNFAPRGWALCAGQIMSIAQNSALFSLLGTMYGGDGMVTFGLPNYCGRSPVGMGQGPGLTNIVQGELGGNENVTLLTNQMPAHVHGATFTGQPSAVSGNASTTVTVDVATSTANPMVAPATGATTYLSATTAKAGRSNVSFNGLYTGTAPDNTKASLGGINASTSGGSLTTTAAGSVALAPAGNSMPVPLRNPYLGTNFVIALEGIVPSRP